MHAPVIAALAATLTLTYAAESSEDADIFRSTADGNGVLPAYSLTDMPDIDFDNIAAYAVDNHQDGADRLARRHLETTQDDEDDQQLTYHILNSFGVYDDEDDDNTSDSEPAEGAEAGETKLTRRGIFGLPYPDRSWDHRTEAEHLMDEPDSALAHKAQVASRKQLNDKWNDDQGFADAPLGAKLIDVGRYHFEKKPMMFLWKYW